MILRLFFRIKVSFYCFETSAGLTLLAFAAAVDMSREAKNILKAETDVYE